MKKTFPLLALLLVILTACPSKKDDVLDNKVPVVSQFVYDGLSQYYLWSAEMTNKKPDANSDPKVYFGSVLNSIDISHSWSQITDDVDEWLASLAGSPRDFGWSLALYGSSSNDNVTGIVNYVFPNTPAANAGIIRGEIISQIDGVTMTRSNYTKLFAGNTLTVGVKNPVTSASRSVSVSPVVIATNPVLKDTVYKDNPAFAGKKIGYLFYTDFITNYNNKLYETFTRFKSEGITELVIDLRYNHGGALAAASYLASMIAPRTAVQNNSSVFAELSYNSYLNNFFDGRNESRKTGFVNSGAMNPLEVNLNLSTVYILATDDSYSASELLTFCLKPYMNVVHVGNNTGGKFTGSWTLHAYDSYEGAAVRIYNETDLSVQDRASLKNWGMQPIVATYKDKNGADFTNPGYLTPTHLMPVRAIEENPASWKPIGTVTDYLLAKAISLITGLPYQGPVILEANTYVRSVYGSSKTTRLYSDRDNRVKNSVHFAPPNEKELRQELINQIKSGQIVK
ncbi:S41 family peptidase [Niabella sp. CJ426]|uniref:S41 family peptidase n=1 Tax=Niabella sp. CJ426 TaxID=3393740 RepID=UPI003CFF259D